MNRILQFHHDREEVHGGDPWIEHSFRFVFFRRRVLTLTWAASVKRRATD